MKIKSRLLMWTGKAIPWAYVLADITAKSPVFHFISELVWDGIFQLDRQVGNTTRTIHHSGLHDRIRRTGIDAGCASAAIIFGYWRIRLYF